MTTANLNAAGALLGRDALSKLLYNAAFGYLIRRANEALHFDPSLDFTSIKLLDMFGFETFEVNDFEQLLINFANEQIQDLFWTSALLSEFVLYQSENVACPEMPDSPGKSCVDLLSHYLVPLLDAEVRLQRPADGNFLRYIRNNSSRFACLSRAARLTFCRLFRELSKKRTSFPTVLLKVHPKHANTTFIISHFAADVTCENSHHREFSISADSLTHVGPCRPPQIRLAPGW